MKSTTFSRAAKTQIIGEQLPIEALYGYSRLKVFYLMVILREHKLTPEEVDFIKRLTKGSYASQVDDTPEWIGNSAQILLLLRFSYFYFIR